MKLIIVYTSQSRICTILDWHCISSANTIVTFALPDSHISLTYRRLGDRTWERPNNPTPLTDIDSPAATALPKPPSSKRVAGQRRRQAWARKLSDPPPTYRLAPTVKHTGQEPGGELWEVFKCLQTALAIGPAPLDPNGGPPSPRPSGL